MRRIVPSQVVCFLADSMFSQPHDPSCLSSVDASKLRGLLSLLDEVSEELLPADSQVYADLICRKERIRSELARPDRGTNPYVTPALHEACSGILQIMSKCPDQAPAPTTSELKFITDPALRENLRNDIGAVDTEVTVDQRPRLRGHSYL